MGILNCFGASLIIPLSVFPRLCFDVTLAFDAYISANFISTCVVHGWHPQITMSLVGDHPASIWCFFRNFVLISR